MINLKKILFVVLAVVSTKVYSQEYPFRVYTSPPSILDIFSRQMVTLGGEVILLNHFGIGGEYGFKFKDLRDTDTSYIKSNGYSYRFELKYYDIDFIKIGNLKNYISLEYRQIKDNLNDEYEYYRDSQSVELVVDNFGVKKNIYIANIKYGIIVNLGKRLYIDAYCGIGIRHRVIKNINREYNEDLGHELGHVDAYADPTNFNFEETSGNYFNPSLGFKFGVKI